MIRSGKRIIKIKSTRSAHKYGNWYKNLLGHTFDALIYSITEAEYTVKYNGAFQRLPDEDILIVEDTKQ